MLVYTLDVLFLLAVVAVSFFASRTTMVRAGINFLAVLLASLFAMAGFERFAKGVARTYLSASEEIIRIHLNFVAVVIFFGVSMVALIWLVNRILPEPPEHSSRKQTIGRWAFSLMTGYLVSAFLLTILQTFPGPVDFWGGLPRNIKNRPGPVMRSAPDCQILALFEYTSSHVFFVDGNWLLNRPVIATAETGGYWETFLSRHRNLRIDAEDYFHSFDVEDNSSEVEE